MQIYLMTLEEAQIHCRLLLSFMSVQCFTEDSEIPSYHKLRSMGVDSDGWCVRIPSTELIISKDEYDNYIKKHGLSPIDKESKIYV